MQGSYSWQVHIYLKEATGFRSPDSDPADPESAFRVWVLHHSV